MPMIATGYCSTFGIMMATRAPLARPLDWRKAPKSADWRSSSPKLMVLPMQVKAGRPAYCLQALTSRSPMELAVSGASSAGTLFG